MRIISRISVVGNKSQITEFMDNTQLPSWKMQQIGLCRKVPDTDHWCALSEGYEFDFNCLGAELLEFLEANHAVKNALTLASQKNAAKAILTIVVTDREDGEDFSTLFESALLGKLTELQLELEISHENAMRDFPIWKNSGRIS